tara:strand:- start:654 stop:1004 length:351 start_codon:yes stop_codon:yes gene_type:complete
MTTKPKTENQVAEEPKKPEKKFDTSAYSCEIILEKTTKEKADDRQLPTDAFNVFYTLDGKEHLDVTRSEKMVNVFDMYYDRYGKDVVQRIDYGAGTIRPNLWGVKKAPEKKKRRKV